MNTNRFWVLKLLGWLFFMLVLLVLIILPVSISLLITTGQLPENFIKHLGALEQLQTYTMRMFVVVWIFFVGGCFASFLNVVAWRVPRGRGILGSSKCPYCNVHLRFQDNLPIVGWLKNGGQCQTCKLPISPRYLYAEIILGSVFLLLTLVQLAGGGINLPFRPTDGWGGFEQVLFSPKWDLIQLLLYFLILLSSLFTFALIEADQLKIPKPIWLFVFALGFGLPMIWPPMQLVSWQSGYAIESLNRGNMVLTSLLGGLAGAAAAWLVCQLRKIRQAETDGPNCKITAATGDSGLTPQLLPESCRSVMTKGLMTVGIFLGWQAVVATSTLFLMIEYGLELAIRQQRRQTVGLLVWLGGNRNAVLLIATLIQILGWRLQALLPFWLG